MRTIAYVDGFSLYFGSLRNTPHRWLNPQLHPCAVLKTAATFYKHLRPNFIASAQFPDRLTDARGTFTKPAAWF